MRTGTLIDRVALVHVFKTKTDFLSGSQSKASHGQPDEQSALSNVISVHV